MASVRGRSGPQTRFGIRSCRQLSYEVSEKLFNLSSWAPQPHTHTHNPRITESRTCGRGGLVHLDLVCAEQGGRSGSPEQLTEAIFVVLLKEAALEGPQPVSVVHLHRMKGALVKASPLCQHPIPPQGSVTLWLHQETDVTT